MGIASGVIRRAMSWRCAAPARPRRQAGVLGSGWGKRERRRADIFEDFLISTLRLSRGLGVHFLLTLIRARIIIVPVRYRYT